MGKRMVLMLIAFATAFTLAACGSKEEHVIVGSDDALTSSQTDGPVFFGEDTVSDEAKEDSDEENESVNGYHFICLGTVIEMDQDMAQVLEAIGEPESYCEAESSAFEGLDKIYTYGSFEIDTYPQDDLDLIASLVVKDEGAETPEGVCIGSSYEDVLDAYGEDYTQESGMMVYRKDNMKLCFIVSDDTVTSIQYFSNVSDE